MKKYAIFDLDNCLSNDEHRIGLIDWSKTNPDERYRAYHAACSKDRPANTLALWLNVTAQVTPIFLTARPVYMQVETVDWINKVLIPGAGIHCERLEFLLMMRNNGDHRPSAALKKWQVEQLIAHYDVRLEQITCAYDDREEVCEMYRTDFGIFSTQLKVHDTCAYTPPRTKASKLLEQAAATFKERNAIYGDNYLLFGRAFLAMFPNGEVPAIKTQRDMDQLQVFIQLFTKMSRYAQSIGRGGHRDSAHDMIVYAAMLEEFTQ